LVIGSRIPFAQGILQRFCKGCVNERRFAQMDTGLINFKDNCIILTQIQGFQYLLWNSGLTMAP